MRLIRGLWETSPHRTALMAVLIVLGAIGQALAAATTGPVLIQRSGALFVVLAVSLTVATCGDLAIGVVAAGLGADWAAAIRQQLCRVAFGQDLPTLEATPVGELLDRIDDDVNQVVWGLRAHGVRIGQQVAFGLVSLVTAFVIWWPAGVGMLAVTVATAVVLRGPVRRIAPLRMREEEAWTDLVAVMEEAIHGQDDVRTSLARPYVLRVCAQRTRQVLRRGMRVWRLSAGVTTAASGVSRLGIVAVVVGGAVALAAGRVGAAQLTSIWLLVIAYGGIAEQISRTVPDLQRVVGAWERVQLLANARQEASGGAAPTEGDIEIRGLTFQYPEADEDGERAPALRTVNLRFARGRSYAVIGRTGSGKSTLAKILARAVDVPRGTVFLDGVDLIDLDVTKLREWIGVVPQRTDVITGTLAENVALFDASRIDQATQVMHELGMDDWVAALPEGMQTRLGEGGHTLSAGQEQIVAFARILVRDPRVVVLDEATARLDPATEAQLQRATERLLHDRIGMVIAHRLSSLRRCDEVVVLADGVVIEAGPLGDSERFAQLLVAGHDLESGVSGVAVLPGAERHHGHLGAGVPVKMDPPALPAPPPARTLREILRLILNDARIGFAGFAALIFIVQFGLDGSVLAWLWERLVDGPRGSWWPVLAITVALLAAIPGYCLCSLVFPQWYVRQMLRIGLRLVHGQTGPRRVSPHTPAEVVAVVNDSERAVFLADNLIGVVVGLVTLVVTAVVSRSVVVASFFAGTLVVSALAAAAFAPMLARVAERTVEGRAAFSSVLVSALSAVRTVKLAGATGSVLAHLGQLERVRSRRQRDEIRLQICASSAPAALSGLLPVAVWGLYLGGALTPTATLVAVTALRSARWFAWTAASVVSRFPSARVWTRRAVAMCGTGRYSAIVPGVDLAAGTVPDSPSPPRHALKRLELDGFTAIHRDGTVGVCDVDLVVERGQLVLVVGPVGCGKSSLLQALAGIVHHRGDLRWNGQVVAEPELFLRPNQVGYVAQLPRVLSGTVADNIGLGRQVDLTSAVSTAQLDHDLALVGDGLGLRIGHKGTRLSGGQLQRLALARALAPQTELLVADDVSSALDVVTELRLWQALRRSGVTVVGSTSRQAALARADHVVVLHAGRAVAQGPWRQLHRTWGRLAG